MSNYSTKNIFTNYNYRAYNVSDLDNSYSGVTSNYRIRPNIEVVYSSPYNTGTCVQPSERKQTPFDIQKNPRMFSNYK